MVQAIIYRKGYSWVIIVSGLLQTFNYIFRVVSIKRPTDDGSAIASFILILVCFRSAWKTKHLSGNQPAIDRTLMDQCICLHGHGTYGLYFTSTARLARIKAWRFTLYFVLLDIVSVPNMAWWRSVETYE